MVEEKFVHEIGKDFHPIPGFDGYLINPAGKVWSKASKRFLTPAIRDYAYVNLPKKKRTGGHPIHVLVATVFLPKPPADAELVVRHLDGSRYNYHVDNLAWGTRSDNGKDAVSHGSVTSDWNHKLSNEDVLQVYREAHSGQLKQDDIATKHGIARTTVSSIKNGYTHSDLTGHDPTKNVSHIGSGNHSSVITEIDALRIFKRHQSGEKTRSISDSYGVNYYVVWNICNGLTWNHVTGLPKKKQTPTASVPEPSRRSHKLRDYAKPRDAIPEGLVPLLHPDLREHYGINRHGTVYSFISGIVMKINYDGRYPRIGIRFNKKNYNFKLHRLLALAFVPNPSGAHLVRHLDDDPKNFAVDNLAWGTVTENIRDASLNGRVKCSVLTDAQVKEIIRLVGSGELSQTEAAKKFGSTKATVSQLMLGRARADITGLARSAGGKRKGEGCHQAKLSSRQVKAIVKAHADGVPKSKLAKRYKVGPSNICHIISGKSWSHLTGIVPK